MTDAGAEIARRDRRSNGAIIAGAAMAFRARSLRPALSRFSISQWAL